MIDAIVFDLDGVLIDSEPVWEEVRRTVVAEWGGTWRTDTQARLMGMSTPEWARYLSVELGTGLPPDELADLVVTQMAQRYADHLPLLPGAGTVVRRLASSWPLGLASSSPRRLIDAVLVAAGFADLFGSTVSTEEVSGGKPAPDVYLAVAHNLGVAPSRCIAVEDSSNGIRSACAAGMRVVAVPQSAYPPSPEALAQATTIVAGLDEITPEALVCL